MLIKAVLNNLPIYYLGLFTIPKKVDSKIIKMQRNFFWSLDGIRKALPLVAWDVMQNQRSLAGLVWGILLLRMQRIYSSGGGDF